MDLSANLKLIHILLFPPYAFDVTQWVALKGNEAFNILSQELCQRIPAFRKWAQIGLAIDASVFADTLGHVYIVCDASEEIDYFLDNCAHRLGRVQIYACEPLPPSPPGVLVDR